MLRILAIVGGFLIALVVAFFVYLSVMDIPAPTQHIEKTVPDARLPH